MNYTLAGNIKPKQNFGSFEQNGSTWLYHTPAGYITLKDGIHHYFARDYQGSTRAVYRENQRATPGYVGQQNSTTYALDVPSVTISTYTLDERMSYFASGLPYRRDYESDAPTDRLHLGKPWLDLDGISLYNNSARLHDPITATFITQDPLANDYTTISPYANTPGNPVNAADYNGMRPIFGSDGTWKGVDETGFQGDYVIMDAEYKDNMSTEMVNNLKISSEGLNDDVIKRIEEQVESFKSRPDYDGYVTLDEANDWYRNGNGAPLYPDISKINLGKIYPLPKGIKACYNLLSESCDPQAGLVYGNITLLHIGDNMVRAYHDTYDFEMKSWFNPLNWGRNLETIIGGKVAGEGTPYQMKFIGTAKLSLVLP